MINAHSDGAKRVWARPELVRLVGPDGVASPGPVDQDPETPTFGLGEGTANNDS